jgi:putative ubiquitin-RnfH superfamily antitoxin RatB of RatAB toxin-antitoxin module
MAVADAGIRVQVCYAKPGNFILDELTVPVGTTLHDVIKRSGILNRVPDIDLSTCRVGIFGKLKSLDTIVRERDRIEIYRPLLADPKEARRRRAVKKNGSA